MCQPGSGARQRRGRGGAGTFPLNIPASCCACCGADSGVLSGADAISAAAAQRQQQQGTGLHK